MSDQMAMSVLFISVAVVVLGWVYLRYRAKVEYQLTLRTAIEKGAELPPEFLQRVGERVGSNTRMRDLRLGVIAIAIGIGIASFGLVIGNNWNDVRPFVGVGLLPILVGLALIGLWKFASVE